MTKIYNSFSLLKQELDQKFRDVSQIVRSMKWQGVDISDKPDMVMNELFNVSFQVPMPTENLDFYRNDIGPNLPWADDHFLERVGREPLNPGNEWRNWPWSHSANKFRDEQGVFTHTYMERFWPKLAQAEGDAGARPPVNRGIRYEYGDMDDVVELLSREPYTRQAFLPIFFPEDTGAVHGGRIPCTLGYHFIQRGGFLHVVYYIRSCDFIRHFADDCYLTVRLALWILEQLRSKEGPTSIAGSHYDGRNWDIHDGWDKVSPGLFTMHITSLHMFRNDWLTRYK